MRRTLPLLIFLTLPLCAATLRGPSTNQETNQSPTKPERNPFMRLANNGAWWDTLSQDSKADFVDGYVSAMANVNHFIGALIKKDTESLTPGPKFDGQMNEILGLSVLAERYEYQEVGRTKLLAGMDTFYEEPLNKLLPIEFAFAWERDTLNGKVAPRDLQKQLDEWRAIVNKQ